LSYQLERDWPDRLEVYGVVPEYGDRGRPPTRKKPGRHWQYVQAIRQEDEQGRCKGVRIQVVFGSRQEVLGLLGWSTAYVERSHLTSRLFNGRQVRQTLAFSKEIGDVPGRSDMGGRLLQFGSPSQKFTRSCPGRFWTTLQPRTPAMAAGLTNHKAAFKA